MGAAQRAGYSRGYAQFEQKLYEQVLKVHKAILAQNRGFERGFEQGIAGTALLPCTPKAAGREGADLQRRGLTKNQAGYDLRRNWGEKNAIAKVAGGDEDARYITWADNGKVVRRAWAQARPALG